MRLLRPGVRIHLIGIGGIGLSAIARVLYGWGYPVSGSELRPSALTDALAAQGITVYAGHRRENLPASDGFNNGTTIPHSQALVIVSSAVPDDNPEIQEALRRGMPVVTRKDILAELTAGKNTIAVAGSHGKTTTSAMIAWILLEAGLDPTFIVGGVLQNLGLNARAGGGAHFVIEADEYDRTFLGLEPTTAVITTLEHDHPDCYPTFGEMRSAFSEFTQLIVTDGLLIICGEDAGARQLGQRMASSHRRVETYGLDRQYDWWADGVNLGNHAAFTVHHCGELLGTCALQVPGRHNVLNALAAFAASTEVGVDFGVAAGALTRFRGTARRFEVKGQASGVMVVDDYAHHPTEIRATLAAARLKYPGRDVWAVFQPHTYSRTAALLGEFAAAFDDADHVVVTGVYAARERNTLGISGNDIVLRMHHPDAQYADTLDVALAMLTDRVQRGDVVITLGAGDGYVIGERLLAVLTEQKAQT